MACFARKIAGALVDMFGGSWKVLPAGPFKLFVV